MLWVTPVACCLANGDKMGFSRRLVDKHALVPELSPGLSRAPGFATRLSGVPKEKAGPLSESGLYAFWVIWSRWPVTGVPESGSLGFSP